MNPELGAWESCRFAIFATDLAIFRLDVLAVRLFPARGKTSQNARHAAARSVTMTNCLIRGPSHAPLVETHPDRAGRLRAAAGRVLLLFGLAGRTGAARGDCRV